MVSAGSVPAALDVAVIGAGLGGLTCAALLAKAGMQVGVFEAASRPGGYLAGFSRGEYHFDTALHWLNQCGPAGLVRRTFDFLDPQAPATPQQRRIRRYKGDSFDYLLTDEPDLLRDTWIGEFPKDAAGITAFFSAARAVGRALGETVAGARLPTMSFGERILTYLRLLKPSLTFLRFLGRSAEKALPHFFSSPKLRSVFAGEESLLSCLAPIGWAYSHDFQLPPRGGSQAFIAWLCRLLEGWGAPVLCGCRVTSIAVDGKRATGVRVRPSGEAGEERTVAAKYVIAACDLGSVYEQLLPAGLVRRRVVDKMLAADLYDSSVTVSVALDTDPRELGFGEELVCLTRDDVARREQGCGDPRKTGISILAPSLRDETLAPAGKGTLTLYAPASFAYGECWATEPGLSRGPAYRSFKKAYAEVLLDRVEATVAPGLRRHIAFYDVATPVTLHRYTGNRGGTTMAQTPSPKNIRSGVASYHTALENLFVGGQWAEYGGGVPVTVRAGTNGALLVLKRERPRAFAAICEGLDGLTPCSE